MQLSGGLVLPAALALSLVCAPADAFDFKGALERGMQQIERAIGQIEKKREPSSPPAPAPGAQPRTVETLAPPRPEVARQEPAAGPSQQTDRRQLVAETQERLNRLGYDAGPVDGRFGARTARAIVEFQRAQGLARTGEATPALLEALRAASDRPHALARVEPTPASPAQPEVVDFEAAPQPSVRLLLPLMMRARPDYYDTDAFAVLHDGLQAGVSGSDDCREIDRVLANDIARARYLPEARARLRAALAAAQAAPSTVVVRLSSPDGVGEYDFARRGFPLRLYLGGAGSVLREGQIFSVPLGEECLLGNHHRKVVDSYPVHPLNLLLPVTGGGAVGLLPMAPERAEAFLAERRHGRPEIRIEALVAVTAAETGLSGRIFAARAVAADDGRVLHTYPRSLFAQAAEVAALPGRDAPTPRTDEAAALTSYLVALHGIRHLPELLDDALVLQMTEREVQYDQQFYVYPGSGGFDFKPAFTVAEVQDRQAKFAAEELAPKFRRMVEAAAAAAPDLVRIEHELRFFEYDTAAGLLRFTRLNPQMGGNRQPAPLLYEAHDLAGLSPAVSERAVYLIAKRSSDGYGLWRGLEIGIRSGPLPKITMLALDRRLELEGVPLERARAEELLKPRDTRFRAAVDVRVTGATADAAGRGRGALVGEVAQVFILDPKGAVIASLSPDAFARPTPAVPKPAVETARLESAPAVPESARAPEPIWTPPPEGPYGPDLLGVRLGMPLGEADAIIRQNMDVGWIYEARREVAGVKQLRPYQAMRVYFSADLEDMIGLYTEPPAAADTVVAALRQRALGVNTLPAEVEALLRDEYGEPDQASGSAALVWGQATGRRGPCAPSPANAQSGLVLVEGPDHGEIQDHQLRQRLMQQQFMSPRLTLSIQGAPPVIDRWAGCGPVLSAQVLRHALLLYLVDHGAYARRYLESFATIRRGAGTTVEGMPAAPKLRL